MGVAPFKTVTIKGEEIKLYYISKLASELGRTAQTIRKWEVSGVLPLPIFKDVNGNRMYSEEQIEVIVSCAIESNVRPGYSIANTNFSARVYNKLRELNKKYLEEE